MKLIIPRKTLKISKPMPGGGFPEEAIEWINLNDSNMKTLTLSTKDDTYKFKFSTENIKDYYGAKYLGKGALTAVYKIQLVSENPLNSYTLSDNKYKNELILRIYENIDVNITDYNAYSGKGDIEVGGEDNFADAQSKFINMWTEHKSLFPENIIDIFMYGEILLNNFYLGYYTITRTYDDETKIFNYPLNDKIKYLKELLQFLIKLREKGYTYRDLKFPNIGADKIGDDYKFIVLDYDIYTILTYDQAEALKNDTITFAVGTYTPLYIFSQQEKFSPDLMYVGGLLYTVKELFKNLSNFNSLLKKLNAYRKPLDKLIRYYISKIDEKIEMKNNLLKVAQINTEIDEIKEKINTLIPIGEELYEEIRKNKYEDLVSIEDKITYIIGRVIKACIGFNYDKVNDFNDFVNYNGLIKLLDELITSQISLSSKDILQKYLKYKQKYLKLKNQIL
jgi:hypothetical protein